MYNGYNLPNNNLNTQVFYCNNGDFQIWKKPPGAQLIHIICIGAGAGGGGGATRASGQTSGGGGGGGSSAISTMTLDAYLCPDYLNIFVAQGGLGGEAGMTGSIGERSYVAIPWTGDYAYGGSVLIQSGNVSAQGGGSGKVGTSAGAAGAGGAASTIFASPTFGGYGNWVSIAGQDGGAGSNGSAAATAIAWGTLFICGGGGGGGITSANGNSNGAQISAPANPIFQNIVGGLFGIGGAGSPGIDILKPYPISTGGAGGGSSTASFGGNGGKGGFGSGGGGGAAGLTGGRGGRGGDGIVIITCI